MRRHTTSQEFIDWTVYLKYIKPNEQETLHLYLAQLACEVRRSWVVKKTDVKLEHFLLKFEGTEKIPDAAPLLPEKKLTRAQEQALKRQLSAVALSRVKAMVASFKSQRRTPPPQRPKA